MLVVLSQRKRDSAQDEILYPSLWHWKASYCDELYDLPPHTVRKLSYHLWHRLHVKPCNTSQLSTPYPICMVDPAPRACWRKHRSAYKTLMLSSLLLKVFGIRSKYLYFSSKGMLQGQSRTKAIGDKRHSQRWFSRISKQRKLSCEKVGRPYVRLSILEQFRGKLCFGRTCRRSGKPQRYQECPTSLAIRNILKGSL